MQTLSNFLVDDKMKLRGIGQAPITTTTWSDGIDLGQLSGYWHHNEIGVPSELIVRAYIESVSATFGETYTFYFVVAGEPDLSDDTPFATITLTAATIAAKHFALGLSREALLAASATAKYMGLGVTVNGTDKATLVINDWLVSGDQFTLDDGTHTVAPKIGTPEHGVITFSGQMSNGDALTVSDGTNTTVFTWGTASDGAVGAAVTVAHGGTASACAANLIVAMNANTNVLLHATNVGNVVTVYNYRAISGGALTETTDAGNKMSVTDFTGSTAGVKTQGMIQKLSPSATVATQIALIQTAIAVGSHFSSALATDHKTLTIRNLAVNPGGTSGGTLTINTDTNSAMSRVQFAVYGSIAFWAYFKGPKGNGA